MTNSDDVVQVASNIANRLDNACGEIGYQIAQYARNMTLNEFCRELRFHGFNKLADDKAHIKRIQYNTLLSDILADEVYNSHDHIYDMAADWIFDACSKEGSEFRSRVIDTLAKYLPHVPNVWDELRR
tara:strand:+ start:1832 stop:2215 length:384 start_codon:yes stop_codon:yes gene_type:complete